MRTSTSSRERSNSCASTSSGGSTGGCSSGSPTDGSSRPHSVCDIVKAGYLHIKRPPTSGAVKLRIKTWQKRYFVLRDQSYDSGTALLDIFNTESGWNGGKTTSNDSYTIDLQTVKQVDEYTESKSFPNAFTIMRTCQGPLILGADSDYDVKDWIVAIRLLADKLKSTDVIKLVTSRRPSCPPRLVQWNSANQLHSSDIVNNNDGGNGGNSPHRLRTNSQSSVRVLKLPNGTLCVDCLVKVQTTEASRHNSIFGEYNMLIQCDDIILRRPGETCDVIKWPIAHIRKFKSEDLSDGLNLVTLDANIHCGTRSGTFLFRTAFGRKLIQRVKDALAEQDIHRDPDKDLDRLRKKCLNKAPSTPNLLNRGSPPKVVPKTPAKPSVRERTQSNPEQSVPNPNSYLHLLPEEQCDPSDAGDYIDDQLMKEPSVQPVLTLPVGTSPKVVKRRHSGLPPLPPGNHHNVLSTSPPNTTHHTASEPRPASGTVHYIGTASDKPPELPPRRSSGTPPPPPPRPQHTLSTHSLPV